MVVKQIIAVPHAAAGPGSYVRGDVTSCLGAEPAVGANGTGDSLRVSGRPGRCSVHFHCVSDDATLRADWRSPHSSRLSVEHPDRVEILRRHDAAGDRGMPNYADPASGLRVFTADFLANRAYCCASGCRHCPYTI